MGGTISSDTVAQAKGLAVSTASAANLAQCKAALVDKGYIITPPAAGTTGVTGAGETGFFGGADDDPAKDLKAYEYSLSAKAKSETIRQLASALKSKGLPGMESINVDSTSLEELAKLIKERVSQFSTNIKDRTDDEKTRKAVKAIAEAINSAFSANSKYPLIDTSASLEVMCRQMLELSDSFLTGVNSELLKVQASVKNVLINIEICTKIMEECYAQIENAQKKNTDSDFNKVYETFIQLYQKAAGEAERQKRMLEGILKINLPPALEELQLALKADNPRADLIKRLDMAPGGSGVRLGQMLAQTISGIGVSAAAADKAHKCLKLIGMSVNDYLNEPSVRQLQDDIDKLQRMAMKSPDTNVAKFIEASKYLTSTFTKNMRNGEFSESFREELQKHGGDPDDDLSRKTKYEKKEISFYKERELLITDFVRRLNKAYGKLLEGVDIVSKKIGSELHTSEGTDLLADCFDRLKTFNNGAKIEMKLISYNNDSTSKLQRQQYISTLRMMIQACETVGPVLDPIKSAAQDIIEVIDSFSDVVTRKYGSAETEADRIQRIADVVSRDVNTSALRLDESIEYFTRMYFAAKIKENLSIAADEMEYIGEKYLDTLGSAVGDYLYKNSKEVNDNLSKERLFPVFAAAGNMANSNAYVAELKTPMKNIVTNRINNVKTEFYKALQAIDILLKNFTLAVARDPNIMNDIHASIEKTQIIAKWYDHATCFNLIKAFDRMRAPLIATNITRLSNYQIPAAGPQPTLGRMVSDNADLMSGQKHYYQVINEVLTTTPALGNANAPALGVPHGAVPILRENKAENEAVTEIRRAIESTLNNFQALKNIINIFYRVGSIDTPTFMTPQQVFKALHNYLAASAFTINLDAAAPAGHTHGWAVYQNFPTIPVGGLYFRQVNSLTSGDIVGQAAGAPGAEGSNDIANPATGVAAFAPGTPAATDLFATEDRYFVTAMKAITAKILVSIGIYDLFNKNVPISALSPVRLIIGGAGDSEYPEVYNEAVELYFRIPRLMEWYYNTLFLPLINAWGAAPTTFKIGMIPEIEGIFGGLFQQIFLHTDRNSLATGKYSESELRAIIREINSIYKAYKDKGDNVVQNALRGLIKEVNRRYGVIRKEDFTAYKNMRTVGREAAATRANYFENVNNFDILPGEDAVQGSVSGVVAPSDSWYMDPNSAKPNVRARELNPDQIPMTTDTTWTDQSHAHEMLKDFRRIIAQSFQGADLSRYKTYNLYLRQTRTELEAVTDPKKRYDIVVRIVTTVSVARNDAVKLVMFHETVVTGLNVLSCMHDMMSSLEIFARYASPAAIRALIARTLDHNTLAELFGDAIGGVTGNADKLNQRMVAKYLINPVEAVAGLNRYQVANIAAIDGIVAAVNPLIRVAGVHDRRDLYANAKTAAECTGDGNGTFFALARMLTDYQGIMRDFIENVFALKSLGFAEVTFSKERNNECRINFDKLRNVCENLTKQVRIMMDLFRLQFTDPQIISFYEGTSENPPAGTLYYYERELLHKYFLNDTLNSLDTARNATYTSSRLATDLGNMFTQLISPDGVGFPVGANANNATNFRTTATKTVETYGTTFSRICFYDNDSTLSPFYGLYNEIGGAGAYQEFLPYGGNYPITGYNQIIRDAAPNVVNDVCWANPASFGKNYKLAYLCRVTQKKGLPNAGPDAVGGREFAASFWTTGVAGASTIRNCIYADGENAISTNGRSCLFMLYELIYQYLATFIDPSADGKIYRNLVDSLCAGANISAIVSNPDLAYPDVSNNAFGQRTYPMPTALLPWTLALVLQRLTRDTNEKTNIPEHLIQNLTDVQTYIKDLMKVNLPLFNHWFNVLASKCNFLTEIIQQSNIDVSKYNVAAGNVGIASAVAAPAILVPEISSAAGAYNFNTGLPAAPAAAVIVASVYCSSNGLMSDAKYQEIAANAAQSANYFIMLLANISDVATQLSSTAMDVFREIGDTPIYFSIGENFIANYEARNKHQPFMPLSLALSLLKKHDPSTSGIPDAGPPLAVDRVRMVKGYADQFITPVTSANIEELKFIHGVRGLVFPVDRDMTIEQMPALKKLLDTYNTYAGQGSTIDKSLFDSFVANITTFLKFSTQSYLLKANLISYYTIRTLTDATLFTIDAATNVPVDPAYAVDGFYLDGINATLSVFTYKNYSINDSARRVWELEQLNAATGGRQYAINAIASSPNTTESVRTIARYVETQSLPAGAAVGIGPQNSRLDEVNGNILSMNLSPVNVHALMNYLPFTNLFNYEFTFDEMISEMYSGPGQKRESTRYFVDFCQNPHAPHGGAGTNTTLGNNTGVASLSDLQRMFRGDAALGMGRPKFLSDLYNSVLLRNTYLDQADYDDAGPNVGIGMARSTETLRKTVDEVINFCFKQILIALRTPGGANTDNRDAYNDSRLKRLAIRNNAGDLLPCTDVNELTVILQRSDLIYAVPFSTVHNLLTAGGAHPTADQMALASKYLTQQLINLPVAYQYALKIQNIIHTGLLNRLNFPATLAAAVTAAKRINNVNTNVRNMMRLANMSIFGATCRSIKTCLLNQTRLSGAAALRNLNPNNRGRIDAATLGAFIANLRTVVPNNLFTNPYYVALMRGAMLLDCLPVGLYAGATAPTTARMTAGSGDVYETVFNDLGALNLTRLFTMIEAVAAEFANNNHNNPLTDMFAQDWTDSGPNHWDASRRTAASALRDLVINLDLPYILSNADLRKFMSYSANPGADANNILNTNSVRNLLLSDINTVGSILWVPHKMNDNASNAEAEPITISNFMDSTILIPLLLSCVDDLSTVDGINQSFAINNPSNTQNQLVYIQDNSRNPATGQAQPGEKNTLVTVNLTTDQANIFSEIGQARFDTVFVRNLVFMTNCQRIITKTIRDEFVSRGLIVSSHNAVALSTTEYDAGQFYPNETIDSVRMDGTPKY